MSNLDMLNYIIGALSPLLIAVILRPGFDARLKVAIMLGTSLLIGFLTTYFSGTLDGIADLGTAFLQVTAAAVVAYEGIFKPSRIAPAIMGATSPKEAPEEAPEARRVVPGGRVAARLKREAEAAKHLAK